MREMSKKGRSKVQRENFKWLTIIFFNLEIKNLETSKKKNILIIKIK